MEIGFWLLLVLHIVSQSVSWIICAHLIETHPSVHSCITAHTFLTMLAIAFIVSIIIGSLPLLVKPKNSISAHEDRTCNCLGCICFTAFTESNAVLTRRRVFFLSLFQAIFFPIWIQLVEHSYHFFGMIFNVILFILVCFTYANVFAIKSHRFVTLIIWLSALTGFIDYIGFLALSFCSFKYN